MERDIESTEKLMLLITDLMVCAFRSLSDIDKSAPSEIVITMVNMATETIISINVNPLL